MKSWAGWLLLVGLVLLSACSLISSPDETQGVEAVISTPPVVLASAFPPSPTSLPVETTARIEPTTQAENTPTSPPPPTATLASVNELPDPDAVRWNIIASGLERPLGLVDARDGSGRLFIVEQAGLIRIWQAGELLPEPFLDLREQVACCGEMGLLGLAFHPAYSQNGYFYVNYTYQRDRELYSRIARFQVSAEANLADPQSELAVLEVQQPYENHNGGALAFGPDGYLYIALGDGGSGGDPLGNGQSLTTLLGKLLRIDVDGGEPYAIPASNPFAAGGGLLEIWAYGLRNPWRFTFDPLTGDLYIGDVGQGDWEEIDFLPAGSPGGVNFGWNAYEGTHAYGGVLTEGGELVFPVAEYGHDVGNSVTGGVVYRGTLLSEWYGVYVYGDFGRGRVWGLVRQPDGAWQNGLLFETGSLISSFGQDASGEVYLVDYGGFLLRLESR